MAILLKNVPMTEEWNNMKLHEDVENRIKEQYQVVYKKSSEDDKWCLYDLYNKDISYDDDFVIMPVGSVYHGIQYVKARTKFVNVIGSTGDKIPIGKSWIDLMSIVYDKYNIDQSLLSRCCTDGNFYVTTNIQNGICWNVDSNRHCNGKIVGGHVLLNRVETEKDGLYGMVFMLPICTSHNVSRCDSYFGSGYFMVTQHDIWALVLDQFVPRFYLQKYIDKDDCNN